MIAMPRCMCRYFVFYFVLFVKDGPKLKRAYQGTESRDYLPAYAHCKFHRKKRDPDISMRGRGECP